jgi:hypothetical protein
MWRIFVIVFFIFSCSPYQFSQSQNIPSFINAQDIEPPSGSIDSICRKSSCRPFTSISNTINLPYVYNDKIFILPNEELYFDGKWKNDSLKNIEYLPNSTDSNNLFIKLSAGELNGVMLQITNPYSDVIKYHALIRLRNQNVYIPTSTCIVLKSGFESWQDKIDVIVIFDIHKTKNMSCIY